MAARHARPAPRGDRAALRDHGVELPCELDGRCSIPALSPTSGRTCAVHSSWGSASLRADSSIGSRIDRPWTREGRCSWMTPLPISRVLWLRGGRESGSGMRGARGRRLQPWGSSSGPADLLLRGAEMGRSCRWRCVLPSCLPTLQELPSPLEVFRVLAAHRLRHQRGERLGEAGRLASIPKARRACHRRGRPRTCTSSPSRRVHPRCPSRASRPRRAHGPRRCRRDPARGTEPGTASATRPRRVGSSPTRPTGCCGTTRWRCSGSEVNAATSSRGRSITVSVRTSTCTRHLSSRDEVEHGREPVQDRAPSAGVRGPLLRRQPVVLEDQPRLPVLVAQLDGDHGRIGRR